MKGYYLFILTLFFFSCSPKTVKEPAKAGSTAVVDTPFPPPYVDTAKTLKENVLHEYILTAKTVITNPGNGSPFDTLSYNKIIAYDFAGCEEPYPSVVDPENKFVPVILDQQYLTQNQSDKILSTLSNKKSYGEVTAACFNPHFALLFYKDNIIVNKINVCLDCNYLISDITIPAETHLKVNKGKVNEYAYTGFTDSGKKAIIDLCKELNFTYGQYEIK